MIWNVLFSKIGGVVLGGLVLFSLGALWDHNYGPNAWKLAGIQKGTIARNAKIDAQNEKDDIIAAQERERLALAQKNFKEVAPHLEKCVLDAAHVEAMNKRMGIE